ncbi:flagellar filament capping protein FliD [Bdellovibrionota bacterium FG-2]
MPKSGGQLGLRFDPIGGGQFKQMVKQLIEAESQPIKALEARKAREEAKLKLFQEFKSKFATIDKSVAEIANFKTFRELKVDAGDGTNLIGVTLEKAEPGSYQIQIDSLAARTSVISNGFENPDEPILGIGFVVMPNNKGENTEIFVDEEQASLRGLANLINKQADFAVRAAVVKDAADEDTPWRLILSAKKDGAKSQVEFPDFYFLDGVRDFYVDDSRDSKNAEVLIDGFPLELESNDISDFLPGVNIHLKQAKPEAPFTLTISEDPQKVAGKMKALVEQVNQIFQFISKQNQVDEKSDTRTTFTGDTGLQTIEYRLRNLLHEGFPVGDPKSDDFRLVFLNQLGVEFDRNGQLTFKEDKFTKNIESDFAGISEAMTGSFGFAYQLRTVLSSYTQTGNGMLALREQGLRDRIKQYDSQIETKTKAVERKQEALTSQFSRLQGTMANLQRQQQSLSAALPAGGGGNPIAQLLGG